MIEQEFHRGWYDHSVTPRATREWLSQHWPEIYHWIVENVHGRWVFCVKLLGYEYDSIYCEYALVIEYENIDDAFLHRMRW